MNLEKEFATTASAAGSACGEKSVEAPEHKNPEGETAAQTQTLTGKKNATNKATKSPKKGNAAAKRKRAQRLHAGVRFVVQILFLILAPGLFSSALNGIKYLCTQVGALEAIEPTSFVAALAAVLVYTVVFGRFFCGYACAFGAMGDILYALATPVRRALHIPSLQSAPRLSKWLQFLKLCVLIAVCALCFLNMWDVVSAWDPWAAFGKITSGSGWEGIAKKSLAVLVIIMVFQALFERSFCRFLCPMGALFSLLPVFSFSMFNRYRPACAKKCNRCQDSCPIDIHPDQGDFHSGECIVCGRCAVGCPLQNVNLVFVPEPEDAKETLAVTGDTARAGANGVEGGKVVGSAGQVNAEGKTAGSNKKKALNRPKALIKIKGSGVGWVIAKAAVLLIACWLVGVTRFVPSPAEVLPWSLPWL